MARKRFTPEQIITILREAEVLLNQSNPAAEICREAKAICSSLNFDFFNRDVLLRRLLPQNCPIVWNSFHG